MGSNTTPQQVFPSLHFLLLVSPLSSSYWFVTDDVTLFAFICLLSVCSFTPANLNLWVANPLGAKRPFDRVT